VVGDPAQDLGEPSPRVGTVELDRPDASVATTVPSRDKGGRIPGLFVLEMGYLINPPRLYLT